MHNEGITHTAMLHIQEVGREIQTMKASSYTTQCSQVYYYRG